MSRVYCPRSGVPIFVGATPAQAVQTVQRVTPELSVVIQTPMPRNAPRPRGPAVPVIPSAPIVVAMTRPASQNTGVAPVVIQPRMVRSIIRPIPPIPPPPPPPRPAAPPAAQVLTQQQAEQSVKNNVLKRLPPYVRLGDLGLTIFSNDYQIAQAVQDRTGRRPGNNLVIQLKGGQAVPLAQLT